MPGADPIQDGAPVVLRVAGLRLAFPGARGPVEVLHGISFHVRKGEKVALVGESGSGKSTAARVVLGLTGEWGAAKVSGTVRLDGKDVLGDDAYIAGARGDRVTMIFQDTVSALNPTFTIRAQFREVLRRANRRIAHAEADARARAALADVRLHDPDRVLDSFVFQLSGGMSQRVMIALALANSPDLLVADEPGSSLDVTVQARTLALMDALIRKRGTGVLFISHNLGVVREFADRIYVIYRGRIVEHATTAQLFADPRHPYTRALFSAIPRLNGTQLPEIPEASVAFADPLIEHQGCVEPSWAP
jgi:ABC-type dipeptide/oligopeptide/nickel transport system ATPase component